MSAPSWLGNVNRGEIELYLKFLGNLTENERQIYIMYHVGWVESGNLAPFIGAMDAKRTPLCEATVFESQQVYEKVLEIDRRWEQLMPGLHVSKHTSTPHWFRVDCATDAMFEDILFNTTVEYEIGTPSPEQRKMHMRLRLDHELATQLAQRWLNCHGLPLQGPLPRMLSAFERKMGGWYQTSRKFVPCPDGVRMYAL